MKIAIIGGGAAGFFAAISCKEHHPDAEVDILEKGGKLLTKVKVSGGGRCNVTHALFNSKLFAKNYPRGEKQLRKAFQQFDAQSTIDWFKQRNVQLTAEPDGRMFPETNDSQTIVDCLTNTAKKLGVSVRLNSAVVEIVRLTSGFSLSFKGGKTATYKKVIVATGGSSKMEGFSWLKNLGHEIAPPVPSLFTFNMPTESIKNLMGVVANPVSVKVQSSKLQSQGPLLITHWGMSGPAILKLSAWGARELFERSYQFKIQVNWLGSEDEENLRNNFKGILEEVKKRHVGNRNPFQLPARLWDFILERTELQADEKWGELSKKKLNRLINTLLNDEYAVSGKTTFKEEFVTCGGVSLQDVNFETMESRKCPGMYFAGEVLDVDGITGGFNFQSAWTTGHIAGKLHGHE